MPESDQVIGWIREIVLDTADPHGLAGFWAALLGGTPVQWYPGWVTLEPPPNGQRLSFQETGTTPRAGPGVHFDVLVSDLDAAQQRVVALGGSYVAEHVSPKPGPDGEPVSWRVCRDPDGHLFCLVTRLSDKNTGWLIIKNSTLHDNPSAVFWTRPYPGIFFHSHGHPRIINSKLS